MTTDTEEKPSLLYFSLTMLFLACVGSGLILLPFWIAETMIHWEPDALQSYPILNAQNREHLGIGKAVQFTFEIPPQQPLLYKNVAVGIFQHYENSEDGWDDWQDDSIAVDLDAKTRILFDHPEPRGKFKTHFVQLTRHPVNSLRWIGYARGQTVSVLGEVTSLAPFTIETRQHFGGDHQAYLKATQDARNFWHRVGQILVIVWLLFLAVMCIFTVFEHLKEKWQESTS